jgi:hypothetical protein
VVARVEAPEEQGAAAVGAVGAAAENSKRSAPGKKTWGGWGPTSGNGSDHAWALWKRVL